MGAVQSRFKFLLHYLQRTLDQNHFLMLLLLTLAQPLQRLVVKPDQLIKRRGKLGLVGINLTLDQVKAWLKQRLGQETTVSEPQKWLHFCSQDREKSPKIPAPLLQPAHVFWLMIECSFRPLF